MKSIFSDVCVEAGARGHDRYFVRNVAVEQRSVIANRVESVQRMNAISSLMPR